MTDWNDTEFDEFNQDSDLVKRLRKEIQERDKKLGDLDKELGSLKKAERSRTVETVLSEKGIPAKVAKLVPSDVEPTAEAVEKWLGEYGDIFGIQTAPEVEEPPAAPAAVPAQDWTTLARVNMSASQGVPPADRMSEAINRLKTMPEADFMAEIEAAQAAVS